MSRSAPLPPPPIASPVAESAVVEVQTIAAPAVEVAAAPPDPQPSRPQPGQAVDLVRDGVGYPATVIEALADGRVTLAFRPAPGQPRSLAEDVPPWDGKATVGDFWATTGGGPSFAEAARRRIEAAREAGVDIPALGEQVAHFEVTPHGAIFAEPATVVAVEDVTAEGPILALEKTPRLDNVFQGMSAEQLREYGTRRGVRVWDGVLGPDMAGTYCRPQSCPVSPGAMAYGPGHRPCGVCRQPSASLAELTADGRVVRACPSCWDAARSCATCRQKSDRLESLRLGGHPVQVCPGCYRAAVLN